MRFVIFSGTTEGRALAQALAGRGAQLDVCVATEYGREEQGGTPGVVTHTGRMDADEMAAFVRGADLCIDATHPYAVEATENIRAACQTVGVPCRRLLRAESPLPPGSLTAPDAAGAAQRLAGTQGNILLTTGAKELAVFAPLGGARLYARVLPLHESLAACEAAGIPHRNILAMQGPFTQELNEALLRQFAIRWLVTKDGGAAGGFAEKAAAAQAAGVRLLVIRRPADAGEGYETILKECEARLSCR